MDTRQLTKLEMMVILLMEMAEVETAQLLSQTDLFVIKLLLLKHSAETFETLALLTTLQKARTHPSTA